MATSLDKRMKQLPRVRRAKVEARAAELIVEEMTLRDVRKARQLTQTEVATAHLFYCSNIFVIRSGGFISARTPSPASRNAAIYCFRPCGAWCARWAAGSGWWPSSPIGRR